MSTIHLYETEIHIPTWVTDLITFRRWLHSDDFPEKGKICFFHGEVYIDMSTEQLYSHNQVRNAIGYTLTSLAESSDEGMFYPDGARISNAEVAFTSVPDGVYVKHDTFNSGQVRNVEGAKEGFLELEGSPDMGLEVVSDSSVAKDNVELRKLYWQAGIREYWLVDARKDPLRFEILRYTAKGYVSVKKVKGQLKSELFGKSFRLTRTTNRAGNPKYTLTAH